MNPSAGDKGGAAAPSAATSAATPSAEAADDSETQRRPQQEERKRKDKPEQAEDEKQQQQDKPGEQEKQQQQQQQQQQQNPENAQAKAPAAATATAATSAATTGPSSEGPIQYKAVQSACMACRKSRVKCDRMLPCARCRRLEIPCEPQLRGRGRPPTYKGDVSKTKAASAAKTGPATVAPAPAQADSKTPASAAANLPVGHTEISTASPQSLPQNIKPSLSRKRKSNQQPHSKKQKQPPSALPSKASSPPATSSSSTVSASPSSPLSSSSPALGPVTSVATSVSPALHATQPSTAGGASGGGVPSSTSPLAHLQRSILMNGPEFLHSLSLQNFHQRFGLANPSPQGPGTSANLSSGASSPLAGLNISTSPGRSGIQLPLVNSTPVGSQYPSMAAPPPVADIGASTASSSSSTSNAAQHGRASHPSSSSSSSSSSSTSKADISAAASANPTAAHVEGISGSKAITSGTGPYRIASTASLGSLGSAQSPLSATPTAGGGASPHHVSLTGPWPPGIGSTAGQGQGDSPTLAAEHRQLHCSPVEALAEAFVDLFHRQEIKTVAATRFVKLCLYLFRAKPTEQLRNFVERAAGVLDANLIDIYNEQSEALNRSAKARQDAASASPTAATAASTSPDVLDASARAEALSRRFGFREKWAVEGAAFAELSVAEGILTARCNPLWNRLFPNNDVLARLGLLDAIALPFPERDGIALFHEISDIVLTKTDDITVSRKVLSMYLGGTPHKLSALVDMHFAMSDDGSVAQCTLRALPLPDSPAFGMQQGCIFKSQYYLQMVPAMATGPPHGPYPPPHAQGHSGDNSSSGSHTTGQHSQSHHQQHHLQQQAHGRPAHAGSHADLASLQPRAHSAAGPSSPSSLYIMDFLGSIKSDADVKTASDAAAARGSSSATAAASSSSSSSSSSSVPKHSHTGMEIDNSALAAQQHQGEARPQTQAQALGKRQPHAALESSGDLPDRARHHGKLSSV